MKSKRDSLLSSIIDTAIDGILAIDSRGIILMVNPSMTVLFGYKEEEMIGQNISMLMPSNHGSRHDGYISNYLRTGKAKIIGIGRDVMGLRKDGSQFPFRLAVSEIKDGEEMRFTGVVHDLSDVYDAKDEIIKLNGQLEEKVQQRTQELENAMTLMQETTEELAKKESELTQALATEKELNELKTRFLSMASHEFRTPLTSIVSSASIIERYADGAHQHHRIKHVNRIKSSVTLLTNILDDFLSLSRLEEGALSTNYADTNVIQLIIETIDSISALCTGTQSIMFDIVGEKRLIITDAFYLRNIVTNLLSNAVKYSDKFINCRLAFHDAHFTIEVHDHGIGIPEEDQEYLFTRFFRANNVNHIQGTGLGLSIVKRYVELLDGEISFESKVNVGSTFLLKFRNKPLA